MEEAWVHFQALLVSLLFCYYDLVYRVSDCWAAARVVHYVAHPGIVRPFPVPRYINKQSVRPQARPSRKSPKLLPRNDYLHKTKLRPLFDGNLKKSPLEVLQGCLCWPPTPVWPDGMQERGGSCCLDRYCATAKVEMFPKFRNRSRPWTMRLWIRSSRCRLAPEILH